MIPIRDNVPSATFPYVTVALIVANVAAFAFELTLGTRKLERFFREFAVQPVEYAFYFSPRNRGDLGLADVLTPLFTSMFLHGGWAHIIGNMLYLWIFGDNVEDRMGKARFLVFYILCGLLASAAHILSNPGSVTPSLGASGAIAGVLGAYLMLYPRARVLVLVPIFIIFTTIEVPALLFLGIWILQNFASGVAGLAVRSAQTGGTAWWAHIGGFVAGIVLVWLFARPERRRSVEEEYWEEY
jgi:membrane associated rhomboid family serine protease